MNKITFKQLQRTNNLTSLRRIRKNEGLSFSYSLYDILITQQNNIVDFDVYLSTKGFNLQRPYVWTPQQQEEFIWSVIYERSIPPVVLITHETAQKKSPSSNFNMLIHYVVDGKQRLFTLKRFMQNEFPIHYNNNEVYWDDLDELCKYRISHVNIKYTEYQSYHDDPITDDEKIIIFNYYNFTGTPQEEKHRERLISALNLTK